MGEIVGTYGKSSGFGFVVPDNQRFLRRIFLYHRENLMNPENRDKVLVKIHGLWIPEINRQREKSWKFWGNQEKKSGCPLCSEKS